MLRSFFFLSPLFYLVPLFVYSQIEKKKFTVYSTKDGLSHNSVTALAQDRFGYIWIGTEYGLNRFDGLNFKQFHSDKNKETLPSEDIISLKWIDSNNLAVLTRLGVNIINIETMRQNNLMVPAGVLKQENWVNRLRGLLTDRLGNYFIITRTGLYHFNSAKELVFRYDDYTAKQLETTGGGFGVFYGWLDEHNIIVSGQHGVYHYNTGSKKISKISSSHPLFSVFGVVNKLGKSDYTVRQTRPGIFILFPYDNDTAIYIDEQRKLMTYSLLPFLPNRTEIGWQTELFEMKDSSFLLSGKEAGIFHLLLQKNTGTLLPDTNKYFNKQKFNDCITDKHNQLWFATNEGLLMEKNNPVNLQFMKIPDSVESSNPVVSIMQVVSDQHYVYATTSGDGDLYIFRKNEMTLERKVPIVYPNKRARSSYTVIKLGNDTILCGGVAGLFWYNIKNTSNGFFELPGWDAKHSWIANIFEDSRRNLWITTSNDDGCYIRENSSGEIKWFAFKQPLVKSLQVVWRMAEDSHGNIWMGGNGLVRYNIATGIFDRYVDSFPAVRIHTKGVSAMAIDKNDNIWLGNSSNGLILFETQKKQFTAYTRAEGLPDNMVKALKITDSTVWIACETGLARMDLRTKIISNVSNSKELLYNDISGNTLFHDTSTGMIYTGIGSQVIGFAAKENIYNRVRPNLLIEKIIIGNDSVIWNPPGIIHTSWKNKNIIVTFNSINYNDPQDQRYAYRIINGNTPNWILLEEQRNIVFSNLLAGTQHIEIEVYSINNRFAPQYLSFTIVISPPFWNTWWFYLLCISLVLTVIYILFSFRINQLKKVNQVRSKISQDLHDEVGATLSGISMYSHLTREQIKKQQTLEVERSLKIIENSAGEMVSKLNDIVWLVNPLHDSLQKLIRKLEEYSMEMGLVKGIKTLSDIHEKISDIKLPMETRRNIFLIFKEAINNAVKYSQATVLEIRVHAFDHSIEILIKDNGKGFDFSSVKKGNGLNNIQKRADEIGAKLILRSKENEGTSVCLQCKIT